VERGTQTIACRSSELREDEIAEIAEQPQLLPLNSVRVRITTFASETQLDLSSCFILRVRLTRPYCVELLRFNHEILLTQRLWPLWRRAVRFPAPGTHREGYRGRIRRPAIHLEGTRPR
jgi:hypothetical protein